MHVNLYSAVSYAVAARTQEIGIRLALGATPEQVLRLVLAQGLRVTAAGVVAGLVVAVGAVRVIAAFLYGVEPTDPLTLYAASRTVNKFEPKRLRLHPRYRYQPSR